MPALTLGSHPQPPPPSDPEEIRRVEHTRKRRRLLYSEHEQDLSELMERQLGTIKREAWGRPDLTSNAYLSVSEISARLYGAPPDVEHDDAAGLELAERIADGGLWPLMQRVQRDTLGLNDMFLRVDVDEGALVFRPVFPDLTEATATPRNPAAPVTLKEWEHVEPWGWVRRSASVVPGDVYYRATADVDGVQTDVSEDVLGGTYEGASYSIRDAAGLPVLPWIHYSARSTGFLYDPYTNSEIVEGSLNVGMYLTYYGHVLRSSAWGQRYAAGVIVEGSGLGEDGSHEEVVTDPATVLLLGVREGMQPLVGQWSSPADPEAILRSISVYERRLMERAGLQAADVTRQSADVRSGYSLAVSRESVRELQRLWEPQFRLADLALIRLCAASLNSAEGTNYPEDGYTITYRGLPPSPVEDRMRLDAVMAMIEKQVITPERGEELLGDVIARL